LRSSAGRAKLLSKTTVRRDAPGAPLEHAPRYRPAGNEAPVTAPAHHAPSESRLGRRPRDDEIDVYGITHRGKVRSANQDHFLIGTLRKNVAIQLTSLPEAESIVSGDDRLAFLAMVADGVGSGSHGEEASREAVEAITRYVSESIRCYYTADSADAGSLSHLLEEAALQCHSHMVKSAEESDDPRGMATTLTLWLGVWPRAYLLQVGDSRAYMLRGGELTQISRDQTMAQELIDQGVLSRADASGTRWSHVLSSAIGGPQHEPVVTCMEQQWDDIGLLCSDGLTRHVSDQRIAERLRSMTSAKQVCEDLLQDALDGGGADNITVLVGRKVKRTEA
jgi:protein phosphatase